PVGTARGVFGQQGRGYPPGAGAYVDPDGARAVHQFGQVEFGGFARAEGDTAALLGMGGTVGGVDVDVDGGAEVLGVGQVRGELAQVHTVEVVTAGQREPRANGRLGAQSLGGLVLGRGDLGDLQP